MFHFGWISLFSGTKPRDCSFAFHPGNPFVVHSLLGLIFVISRPRLFGSPLPVVQIIRGVGFVNLFSCSSFLRLLFPLILPICVTSHSALLVVFRHPDRFMVLDTQQNDLVCSPIATNSIMLICSAGSLGWGFCLCWRRNSASFISPDNLLL